ncbi:MAG: o-succinylbenzoate synthase [bacterium]|nr:o-succinylbenzoate synthase [bacterium]
MKGYKFDYVKRDLEFSFEARTSRGTITTHSSYVIRVQNAALKTGWGEAAPLVGLSQDAVNNFEAVLSSYLDLLNQGLYWKELPLKAFPSIQFALETAIRDVENGGKQELFQTSFLKGAPIAINGLVWMSELPNMLEEAISKAAGGYDCIKFKIGAHDHDAECRLLEQFRKLFGPNKVQIRLDANGAFKASEALDQLKDFSKFLVHSIEQPIAAKQLELMQEVCAKSSIPVALDEELIGVDVNENGRLLLQLVQPKFLILKPTLLGGLGASDAWVNLAEKQGIDWWATSALESNIGLNAIAQWTTTKGNKLHQGLGTGALYANNIESPLVAKEGYLHYNAEKKWKFPNIER